jgi:hypothetical protein
VMGNDCRAARGAIGVAGAGVFSVDANFRAGEASVRGEGRAGAAPAGKLGGFGFEELRCSCCVCLLHAR